MSLQIISAKGLSVYTFSALASSETSQVTCPEDPWRPMGSMARLADLILGRQYSCSLKGLPELEIKGTKTSALAG